jgi:hypothetical protein
MIWQTKKHGRRKILGQTEKDGRMKILWWTKQLWEEENNVTDKKITVGGEC